jgi:hypothetical protein
MITLPYLQSRPDTCVPIKQPQAWEAAGYYPTRYCIRYLADDERYTVSPKISSTGPRTRRAGARFVRATKYRAAPPAARCVARPHHGHGDLRSARRNRALRVRAGNQTRAATQAIRGGPQRWPMRAI